MTEHFGFFDAMQDSNGNYDREYNAQQWNEPFRALVTTGVMKGAYNQLEVSTNGANMVSTVKSGIAFIEGRFYFNDALVELTHDTEVIGLNRIDRIVVRMDTTTDARYVKTFIKKGVPSTNSVPPTLTQTPTVYEISLAQVRVVGGQTFVAANAVTDERGKDVICPWAGSKILPNFDNSSIGQPKGIASLDESGTVPTNQLPKSFPGQSGIVEVSNSLITGSQSTAATSYVTKQLNDLKASRTQMNSLTPNGNAGWDLSNTKFFKDEFGIVHVYLNAVVGTRNESTFITTGLPVGYRPFAGVMQSFAVLTSGVSTTVTIAALSISAGGDMILSTAIPSNGVMAVGYFSFKTTQ